MGKSTHTWFLAVLSRSVLCLLSRFQSGSLCFCVLCFCEDSLPLIIIIIAFHHISQGCSRGLRIFWRLALLLRSSACACDGRYEKWEGLGAGKYQTQSRRSTPPDTKIAPLVQVACTLFHHLLLALGSISMLNRGLCDCCSMYICVCVCVEYLLHQQYSSVLMRGSLIDFFSFHFVFCRRVTSRCVWYILCPLLLNCNGFLSV